MSNTTRGDDWREMPLTNLKTCPHEPETLNSHDGGWLLNINGYLGRLGEELSKHLSFKK